MRYDRTIQIIKEQSADDGESTLNKFLNITKLEDPTYSMGEILLLLTDMAITEDELRYKLVQALITNFELIWIKLNMTKTNLERIANNMVEETYNINAFKGLRVATKKEVDNGVIGLKPQTRWALGSSGEDIYKQFQIMLWLIHGRMGNYSKAGYKYTWNKGAGRASETFLELYIRAGETITSLYSTLREPDRYQNIITAVNKKIRAGKFKYPTFAVDEVKENLTVKKLLFNAEKEIWNYKGFEESKVILTRIKKDSRYRPTPLDISIIREDLESTKSLTFNLEKNIERQEKKVESNLTDEQRLLKEQCDIVDKAVEEGHLKEGDWGPKIVSTLKKYNYKYCSEKQMNVIVTTIKDLDMKKQLKEVDKAGKDGKSNIITDYDIDNSLEADIGSTDISSVMDVMDALGRGDLQIDSLEDMGDRGEIL